MKTKKQIVILLGIGIVLLVILLLNNYSEKKQFLSIRYYDQDGKQIKNPLSINIPSTFFIDLTVSANNDGSLPLSCSINGVSPTEFDLALNRTTKQVMPSKSVEWTSNLISLSSFLTRTQPTIFNASINCQYSTGSNVTYLVRSGSIDINVKTYCGDYICYGTENEANCPFDCFTGQRIQFRTSSLTYGAGSAIAYTSTCGSGALSRYGYDSPSQTGSSAVIDCTYFISQGAGYIILGNLPGGFQSGYNSPVLIQDTIHPNFLIVCQDKAGSKNIYYRNYILNDQSFTAVDNYPGQLDSTKEVLC